MCCYMCRVGYMTVEYCNEVVTNYSHAHIPLETFITDGQYTDGYMDFTLSDGYPLKAFRSFVDKLHAHGQRWVSQTPTFHDTSQYCMHCMRTLLLG